MRRRREPTSPRRIGDILPETLRKQSLYLPTKDRPLIEAWNRAVGAPISGNAQPDRLRDDVLYVRVATSVWMHELQYMKQDIIARLNAILGKKQVSQIRFFIGEIETPAAKPDDPPRPADASRLNPEERRFISLTTGNIADAELKEAVERAMVQSILKDRQDS